ncbi:MAG: cell filamentation protein Fic, partial [Bacilli bacterium]|nr:cell filamentation protein Fic [Bacilli bacterium]
MRNVAELLHEQELLKSRINNMIHGSIEVRDNNGKKYIYVHFRDNGISTSKYAGEYSIELNNLILENNRIVKEYKKQLKEIKKELGVLQYTSEELTDQVKINIDLARRNMVESIYKQAKLEGVATTYSDTETIVNGGKVKDMTATDIAKVINLKHAWEFILNKNIILSKTDFNTLSMINRLVLEGFYYNAGMLRTLPVDIGGTTWKPDITIEMEVKNDIDKIVNSSKNIIDTAIELLLYVV